MNPSSPTAAQLEKLPLRAVVAFAARAVRRYISILRGVVSDDVLDDALNCIDAVWIEPANNSIEQSTLMCAAYHVAEAYAAAPPEVKSLDRFAVVFAVMNAAIAAAHLLSAVVDPKRLTTDMMRAARAAESIGRLAGTIEGRETAGDVEAVSQDYNNLVIEFGEKDSVVIGEVIVSFKNHGT